MTAVRINSVTDTRVIPSTSLVAVPMYAPSPAESKGKIAQTTGEILCKSSPSRVIRNLKRDLRILSTEALLRL